MASANNLYRTTSGFSRHPGTDSRGNGSCPATNAEVATMPVLGLAQIRNLRNGKQSYGIYYNQSGLSRLCFENEPDWENAKKIGGRYFRMYEPHEFKNLLGGDAIHWDAVEKAFSGQHPNGRRIILTGHSHNPDEYYNLPQNRHYYVDAAQLDAIEQELGQKAPAIIDTVETLTVINSSKIPSPNGSTTPSLHIKVSGLGIPGATVSKKDYIDRLLSRCQSDGIQRDVLQEILDAVPTTCKFIPEDNGNGSRNSRITSAVTSEASYHVKYGEEKDPKGVNGDYVVDFPVEALRRFTELYAPGQSKILIPNPAPVKGYAVSGRF